MAKRVQEMPHQPPRRWDYSLSEVCPFVAELHAGTRDAARLGPTFDMHYEVEMGIVLAGRCRRYLGETQATLAPGDVWSCGIWEPHGYQFLGRRCVVLVLIVRPEFLANLHLAESPGLDWMAPFKKDPAGRLPLTRTGDRPEVLDLAWRMADLVEADDSLRPLRLRLLFMELLAFFLGREDGCQPAHDSRTDASARISPALALAFSSRRLITNQEAAQACRMVKDHFLRAFQRTMGLSFVRFAMRSRLRGAAHDVLTADLPLKAIAAQWGFTDKSHLNRLFRQHYGCTPREFRDESAHLAAADGRPGAVQRKRNAV